MRVDVEARRPRRVLMTADAVGGVWTYALDLAHALGRRGTAVDLAVMGPAPATAQRGAAARAGIRVHHRGYRLEWMADPWEDVDRAGEWLLDLEARLRPDLVHLNGYCHAPLPWRAPVLVAGHSCVRSWWRAVHGDVAPSCWDRYTERVRRGCRAAGLVVTPTVAMLEALEREYGPLGATRVIPNGRGMPSPAHARRAPIVFAAGRVWDEAKNIHTLCAAAAEVSWPVYVAGDPGETTCAAGVQYLGPLDEASMREWYARASIYVLPARYEPFGLSILEAALSGCALVLGDIRSLRENWNGAARFVPPDNRRALAAAVQTLIDQPALRGQLARRAQRRAQQFTVGRMADGYTRAYAALAGPRHRSAGEADRIRESNAVTSPWRADA